MLAPRSGGAEHYLRRAKKLGQRPELESLDYDIDASTLFESGYARQPPAERRLIIAAKWLVCGASGAATGALAFVLDVLAADIQEAKWRIVATPLATAGPSDEPSATAFASTTAALMACGVALVTVACTLSLFVEPISAGSGIPEVKTYLQGCRIPRMLRVSTLACKAVGVLFSVSGGLVCGKEGPMIHAGAIIASGISQGSSKTFRCRTAFLKRFRNDHDKRDFVSAGAAAGVAAAFGAPIGGVLFALEEAATHWSQQLTWRTFFCAICSTLFLNLLLSSVESHGANFGQLSHPGLITFGSFIDCQEQQQVYSLSELVVFIVIGIVCGGLGAAFNALNRRLTLLRGRRVRTKRARLLEALIIAALTALASCMLPLLLPCVPIPPPPTPPPPAALSPEPAFTPPGVVAATAPRWAHPAAALFPTIGGGRPAWSGGTDGGGTDGGGTDGVGGVFDADRCNPPPNALQNFTHRFVCKEEGFESPLVRLLLTSHKEGIKVLFHAPATHGMSPSVCLVFFAFSFVFGLFTYGLALPSGLFVPCIMAGAALGRLVGELFGPVVGDTSPGHYALVGAAGMLGGICRMTISIAVIVIESTGNVVYAIPIAVTIMFAKLVGDFFTEGIYDLHIKLKGYPILPDHPPDTRAHLQASDVMARPVRTVSEHEQVGTLLKLLRTTEHNSFPVTAHGGGGGVLGIILRDQVVTILLHRRFETRRSASPHLGSYFQQQAGPYSQPPLSADDFLRPWAPTSLEQLALTFTPEDLAKVVNLRPYINEAALVTLRTTSLRRVSRLFLTMGLRHLLVVETCPKVVGVITRKDLIYAGEGRSPPPRDRHLTRPLGLADRGFDNSRLLRRLRAWCTRARSASSRRASGGTGGGRSLPTGHDGRSLCGDDLASHDSRNVVSPRAVRSLSGQLTAPMLGAAEQGLAGAPDSMRRTTEPDVM